MKFLIPLVLVLLAACAQQPRLDAAPRPARETIERYTLEGRVSVKRGGTANQAALVWQHSPGRDDIDMSGPLGQRAARLSRDADGARLVTASRETVVAPDWSSLAERLLGAALPLDDVAHWVTATLAAAAEVERDSAGRPQRAWANGWQIVYLAYESPAPDALPTLIEMHRDDIDVRLKIDTWQLD